MTGAEKAAVVLLASGPEQASRLFTRLDLDEVKEIGQAMASLGVVPGEKVEATLNEFVERVGRSGALIGGFESVERLLGSFLDTTKVMSIMDEIRGPAGRTVWDKLGNVNETVLASYLKNEYPQTIAVIRSKIKPETPMSGETTRMDLDPLEDRGAGATTSCPAAMVDRPTSRCSAGTGGPAAWARSRRSRFSSRRCSARRRCRSASSCASAAAPWSSSTGVWANPSTSWSTTGWSRVARWSSWTTGSA